MYTFALNEIKEIEGKLKFFKLSHNGKCEFDEFYVECSKSGNLKSELIKIQARMQQLADLKSMPKEKYRDITPKNDLIKEYEIKTKHLRVYLFHDKNNGRVIVSGGRKTTQKKDILHFRKIKKEYFNKN
jgi:putative component of toxin-antitoxin plasmid stabilization module